MTTFPAYAGNFELYPKNSEAFHHLSPLIARLQRIEFNLHVIDPSVNQGQMASTFDVALEKSFHTLDATPLDLPLSHDIPQELDFAFTFAGRKIAVEIEKANREKILRDILKCHMYLHSGADFALVVLAKNYPHKHGVWNLFEFGVQRFDECRVYGFGTPDKLGRILILGFEQFASDSSEPLSVKTRENMRRQATQ
jgi:hypothetical protein